MVGFFRYWWLCSCQAWEDTMTALGWTRRHPAVYVLAVGLFVATVAVLSQLEGNPAAFGEIIKTVSRALTLVIFLPIVFFVALVIVAPYRLHQRQSTQLVASEGHRADLEKRLAPKLEFLFWRGCCGVNRLTNYFYVGVRNPTAITIKNVLVYISVRHVGVRHLLLPWVGSAFGDPIDIDPSPEDGDRHFSLGYVLNSRGGNPKLRMTYADPQADLFEAGQFEIFLSVTGADITPTVVSAIIVLSKEGEISLHPLPGSGWALERA